MNLMKYAFVLLLASVATVARAGTHHYYYTDPQGTVLAKADASGVIIATYDYAPYGTAVASMSPAPSGPGYTGHVNDPDTGLVYMQARYYDPEVGRFLSVDPVSAMTKFSRYTYASNNPIVNIDPDGKSDIPFGDCSKNPNCSYTFISSSVSGGSPSGGRASGFNAPAGTPESMKKYFIGITASDRIKAAMAVADYYGIGRVGVNFAYSAQMSDRAETLKAGPNGDGQITVGPNFFKSRFGFMGAILSHELEAHWKLQLAAPGLPARDDQSRYMREVQAYRVELSEPNQRRFGLTHEEVESERSMLNRYYNALTHGNKEMVDKGIYKQL